MLCNSVNAYYLSNRHKTHRCARSGRDRSTVTWPVTPRAQDETRRVPLVSRRRYQTVLGLCSGNLQRDERRAIWPFRTVHRVNRSIVSVTYLTKSDVTNTTNRRRYFTVDGVYESAPRTPFRTSHEYYLQYPFTSSNRIRLRTTYKIDRVGSEPGSPV